MSQRSDVSFDVASALSLGQRPRQEDALVTDFPIGSDCGFVVLSDGMGGHAAGGKASKIAVTEVFSELVFQREDEEAFGADVAGVLQDAALAANRSILAQSTVNRELAGMGATLVAPVFLRDRLHWISIGDSLLYLFRDGQLRQVNEDHSLAPQIDLMAENGLIDAAEAASHPDRNCLTSALGSDRIPRIDCPAEPLHLVDGDVVIVASDGLKFLPETDIVRLAADHAAGSSAGLARALLAAVEAVGHPDQDNLSLSVVRVRIARPAAAARPALRLAQAVGPEAPLEGLAAACRTMLGGLRRGRLNGAGAAR